VVDHDVDMVHGSALAELFFERAVKPIIEPMLSGVGYTAGRLGSGSDVLDLDDDRSHDHDFGCRLTVLVDDEHRGLLADVDAALEAGLPHDVDGWPTRFPTSWNNRIGHKVDLHTVHDFAASRLGFDLRSAPQPAEWLCLTGQSVLEVAAGPVFHDTTTAYRRVKATLEWYPPDLWRYVLAAGWRRLGQELPFVGRTAELGDEAGSRIITARLARDLTHLGFMVERTWMPYPKWAGTVFRRSLAPEPIESALTAAMAAAEWPQRQRFLAQAVEHLAERHRAAGFDLPRPTVVSFFDRPFVMTNSEIHSFLVEGIVDDAVRDLPPIGAVEQWCDNVDILSYPQRRAQATALYSDA
jgi:hypothetical protein